MLRLVWILIKILITGLQKAEFHLEFGPNYHPTFEIRLPSNIEEVTVIVRDQTNTDIWECEVDLTGKVLLHLQHLDT